HYANISEAGDVGDPALQPKAEPGMRDRSVTAQVPVPAVMRDIDAELGHARVEHVEPLLALAATDDLADPGRENVHRRHGLTVVVHAHVEGFDRLRIVHHDDRLLHVLFRQITLVLGLEIDAPCYRKLEFLLRALENRDRLAVIHAHEFG